MSLITLDKQIWGIAENFIGEKKSVAIVMYSFSHYTSVCLRSSVAVYTYNQT